MALEDNVAVSALAVSLVALLIALTQASVQLFSTAEGYRKCAESIIGPWSAKRRRKWLWSEFRFETQYVTPHIALFNPYELREAGDKACLLSLQDGNREKFVEVEMSLHPDSPFKTLLLDAFEYDNFEEAYRCPYEAQQSGSPLLIGTLNGQARRDWNGSMVTWLAFLREAHLAYLMYWPNERCIDSKSPSKHKLRGLLRRADPERSSNLRLHRLNVAVHSDNWRTDAGVIYRTWSWDLMPDMVRPLATSTVGDIIVLALRLGMEWTALDPGRGIMQASGNGRSLTATEVRGLGMLLTFNTAGGRGPCPYIVPSRAADQLMCGVLPGCPILVRQEFNLIGRNLEILKDDILAKLGLREDQRATIVKRDRRILHNDILTLLCDFLPQMGSPASNHFCWFWRETSPYSVFHWWEGRFALLRGLRSYVSHTAGLEGKRIHTALDLWETLASGNYEADFFARWNDANLSQSGEKPVKSLEYLEGLRVIFNWTTDYFINAKFHKIARAGGTTVYIRLVAAHLKMVNESIEITNLSNQKYRDSKPDISQNALKAKYDLEGIKYYWFMYEMYEYARGFVDHLQHDDFGVVKDLREVSDEYNETDVVEAWWVMMLRGVAWDMATVGRAGPGEAIPAYLYKSQTPVWIT